MFFLTEKEQKKLLMIYLLSNSKLNTNQSLSKIGCSKRQTKNLIKELNYDIRHSLKQEVIINISSKGNIKVINKNRKEILLIFYSLKLSYLEKSLEFKILYLLIVEPKLTIKYISEHLFISQSYIRRKIKTFNVFLNNFNFNIELKKGLCQFSGNEQAIQIFLYILMNDAYTTMHWPLLNDKNMKLTITEQSLNIILTIINNRKDLSIAPPQISKELNWVISQMISSFNIFDMLKNNNPYFMKSMENKLIGDHFIFFCHIYAPIMIPKDVKISLGKIFKNPPNGIFFYTNSITNALIKKFNLSYNNEKILLVEYSLILIECFNEFMNETTTLFEELVFPPLRYSFFLNSTANRAINNLVHNVLIEENRIDILENKKLQEYICEVIYTILKSDNPPEVKIYLRFTKSFTAQFLVQNRLEAIFKNEVVRILPSINNADLIVTDSLNFQEINKKDFIFFNTITSTSQWDELLKNINRILLSKNLKI